MRLRGARAFAVDQPLENKERDLTGPDRQKARFERFETPVRAPEKHHQPDRAPQPAIAAAGSENHPLADPQRRLPSVYPQHNPAIARCNQPDHALSIVALSILIVRLQYASHTVYSCKNR